MKKKLQTLIAFGLFLFSFTHSDAQIITTVAGNTIAGYDGDGSLATSAEFNSPNSMAIDAAGNMYVADYYNHVVRKINTSGIISTFAGNLTPGYSGDGDLAVTARLNYPYGVAVDASGNVYISDKNNSVIRKVNTSGVISTYAGHGIPGYSGDGGPARSANLYYPAGIALDTAGNLFISDSYNQVIRKVDTEGIISTVAGNQISGIGYAGDGGDATSAQLNYPWGLAVDKTGNIYIGDEHNNVIRKVNTSGIISTFAGNSAAGYAGDGGLATSAKLNTPDGVAVDDGGNVYITDFNNNVIRKVNTSGIISTFAGNGTVGYSGDGGSAVSAQLNLPSGITLDAIGNVYFADNGNNVIRKVIINVGIDQLSSTDKQIMIYPNPNNGIFSVTFNEKIEHIEIIDVLGQQIYSSKLIALGQTLELDLTKQTKGTYFIRLTQMDKNVITKKLVIAD